MTAKQAPPVTPIPKWPDPPALPTVPPHEPTLLEKEVDLLNTAVKKLHDDQETVAKHQANVAWIQLNPMAEQVFKQILAREVEAQLKDRRALDAQVRTGPAIP